ncbi:hypothetical protein ACWDNI_00150 [Nocardia niigatensis]
MRALPNSRRTSPRSTRPATTRDDQPGSPLGSLRRFGVLAAAATITCAAAVAFAPGAGASISPAMPESDTAHTGILQAVSAHPDPTLIPDDFVTAAGYRPVIEAGMLIDPNGDCSSPVPLPAEFESACKSHDLGYDLLRYAAAHGRPLGPWARQTVDAALEHRMHAACDTRESPVSRAQCQVMATVATTAVDLNSIRQDYGTPVYEPFFEHSGDAPSPATLTLAGLGLAAGLAGAATVLARRTRRTAPAFGFGEAAVAR